MHPGQDVSSLWGELWVSSHLNVPAFWILGAEMFLDPTGHQQQYLPLLSDYRGEGRSAGGKTSGTTGTTGTPSAPAGRRRAEELS